MSDENAISGVNSEFVRELIKRGIVLAAMICGVLVFGCKRVFAMEGAVNAGYGSVLLGLSAFFSMAGLGRCLFYSLIVSNYRLCGW